MKTTIPYIIIAILATALAMKLLEPKPIAESSEKSSSHSESTEVRAQETTTPLQPIVFSNIVGRDTALANQVQAIMEGLKAGSFNFYQIQPALGRDGNDTISGFADAYYKRLNVKIQPAPLVFMDFDTITKIRDSIVEKTRTIEPPTFSVAAYGMYGVASELFPLIPRQDYGGGVEGAVRTGNLQLVGRAEYSLVRGAGGHLMSKFFIWEK